MDVKPKPILIVRIPQEQGSAENIESLQKILDLKITDYHNILVLADTKGYEFEVFYEKDFNHLKYNKLKQLIKEYSNG